MPADELKALQDIFAAVLSDGILMNLVAVNASISVAKAVQEAQAKQKDI